MPNYKIQMEKLWLFAQRRCAFNSLYIFPYYQELRFTKKTQIEILCFAYDFLFVISLWSGVGCSGNLGEACVCAHP